MVSILQRFINSFRKEKILTHLGEVDKDKKERETSRYIQSLEAQISNIKAKKKDKQTESKQLEYEKELVRGLNKKAEDIEKTKYEGSFALRKLFNKLIKDKKFAKSLEIVDKDDNKVFDKFYSIVILKDGKMGIQGVSGQIWSEGESLNEIIFKPETLKNQIRRKRILMPYDENFNHIPDLEKVEMPEMSYNEQTEEYSISEERFKPFKQMIVERDAKVRVLRKDKEHHEQVITDLRNKLADIELAKNSWKNQAEAHKSELIMALNTAKDALQRLGKLDTQLTVANSQKILADEIKEKYESAFDEVLDELEDNKSKSIVRQAKDEVWSDIERARKNIPKEIYNTIKEEVPRMMPTNPGEKLGEVNKAI